MLPSSAFKKLDFKDKLAVNNANIDLLSSAINYITAKNINEIKQTVNILVDQMSGVYKYLYNTNLNYKLNADGSITKEESNSDTKLNETTYVNVSSLVNSTNLNNYILKGQLYSNGSVVGDSIKDLDYSYIRILNTTLDGYPINRDTLLNLISKDVVDLYFNISNKMYFDSLTSYLTENNYINGDVFLNHVKTCASAIIIYNEKNLLTYYVNPDNRCIRFPALAIQEAVDLDSCISAINIQSRNEIVKYPVSKNRTVTIPVPDFSDIVKKVLDLESDVANIGEEIDFISGVVDNLLPIGTIIAATTLLSLFDGWRLCNGGTLNGITIPDLRDKFLQGWGAYSVGKYISAGLPNLCGWINVHYNYFNGAGGVFTPASATESVTNGNNLITHLSAYDDVYFNAAQYNPIYGNSDTVQPPAYTVFFYMKVK